MRKDETMDLRTVVKDEVFLESILAGDFTFPYEGIHASQLAFSLMDNLKSIDPKLRDNLSYSILERILQEGLLSATESEELLALAVSDEYLFSGIGDVDSDTVFSRAFSVLVIAAVLESDADRKVLPPDLIHRTTNVVLDYARRERDHRGFVDDKGWAHAAAHTADALDSCAQHPVTTLEERVVILNAIAEIATLPQPLAYNEDDRLAFPVHRIIQRNQVDYDDLHAWLSRFDIETTVSKESAIRWVNAQHFLRSLYFLMYWEQPNHPLLVDIGSQLKKLNVYYRYRILPMDKKLGFDN